MEAHTLIQYIVIVVFGLVCCFVFIRHGRKHDRNCVRKRNNKRMHRAMDSTPSVPTTAAQPSSSSDSEPNAGGIYSLQQLQAMLKAIKKVYPKYGPRLASWWAQQGQAEWLEFLLVRVCCCWDTSSSPAPAEPLAQASSSIIKSEQSYTTSRF